MDRRKDTRRIVIHHAATPPGVEFTADDIRRWHVEDNGWRDIGYHIVIRVNGQIEFGRHMDDIGAHAPGVNFESVGICLIGTGPEFPDIQMESLDLAVAFCQRAYPGAEVVGHRDVGLTQCPGFDARLRY